MASVASATKNYLAFMFHFSYRLKCTKYRLGDRVKTNTKQEAKLSLG